MKYQLEKALWTQDDFDIMGWHDSHIHGISFRPNFELLFDLDYIFKWVLTGKTYKFWIAPCTLIFENCFDVRFDLAMTTPELEIQNISRENPKKPGNAEFIGKEIEFDWIIETVQGDITFTSIGFNQYVRREPVYSHGQKFELEERGGVSFDRSLTP